MSRVSITLETQQWSDVIFALQKLATEAATNDAPAVVDLMDKLAGEINRQRRSAASGVRPEPQ